MHLRQDIGSCAVMDDARIREQSQLQRASVKRPWDVVSTLSEQENTRYAGRLPPVDEIAQRRPSISQSIDARPILSSPHEPDARGPVAKRTKLEENENNSMSQINLDSKSRAPQHRPPPPPSPINPPYCQSPSSPSIFSSQQTSIGALVESLEESSLCRSCRRLVTLDEASNRYSDSDTCESCRNNPEYSWVTQKAANALTQLVDTLRSGICSEKRGVIRQSRLYLSASRECPPLSQFGLKQTLNWILGRIDEINSIADDLVSQVPTGNSQWSNKELLKDGNRPLDGPNNNMKRHIDADLEEISIARSEAVSIPDARAYTRRNSSASTSLLGDEPTTVTRPHLEYKLHGHPPRITFMNPPLPFPTPTRQLPSPPGRSHASPTLLSFPSPSTPSFGAVPQVVKPTPELSLHASTSNTYLPPISTSHQPDSALRDYSSSLQHEVSVQKIALSSLQGEHDKLLAAFSRSQLRASALEKKHAVSDNEIINLSEEKVRLQQHIAELERDVEELSRSRDGFRKAAVQEGSQYVEIVKKATRLEEIAGAERRTWNKLKEHMERRIKILGGENLGNVTTIVPNNKSSLQPIPAVIPRRIAEDLDIDTPTSSTDLQIQLKMEYPSETRPTVPTSVEELTDEVRHLQARCQEAEDALRAVRDDGRSMEGILKALLEKVGLAQLDC